MRIFLLFILLTLSTEVLLSQSFPENNREAYIRFNLPGTELLEEVDKTLSIDKIQENTVYAYANKEEFEAFKNLNIPFEILTHPGKLIQNPRMYFGNSKSNYTWDAYPSYESYVEIMYEFEADYPELCEIKNIGTTADGRSLLFAKISDNVSSREPEPRFMYTSTMHGDETTGYILSLRLINYLLENYATNPEVADIVNNTEIWINPLENPDGTYTDDNATVSGATRYNGNSVDLNRNYPNPVGGSFPNNDPRQPEAMAMINLTDSIKFVLAANMHGGAEVVNYPWDSWDGDTKLDNDSSKAHPDDYWWQYIGKNYCDTLFENSSAGYFTGVSSDGYTNGGDWYIATGTRQDYMQYYKYQREFTLELSNTKLLPGSQLPIYWERNYRSLINYIKEANYGIQGFVTDSCSGAPIEAKVFVLNHDTDSSHVYSYPEFGDYYRPIAAGTYTIAFSAPGYYTKTAEVTAAFGTKTILNIQLSPKPPVVNFDVENFSACNPIVNFVSNAPGVEDYSWHFGDGYTSSEANPTHQYETSGIYTVKLVGENCKGKDSLTIEDMIPLDILPAPIANDAERCGPGNVILTAQASDNIHWYSQASGGLLIDTGNTITTPLVNQTQTFYAENVVPGGIISGGKTDNSGDGGFYSYNNEQGLLFDCNEKCFLRTVTVYAENTQNRIITLKNSLGTIIYQKEISIEEGEQNIDLDFMIAPGEDYILSANGSPDLFRNGNTNSSPLPYPYQISDVLSIKGNTVDDLKYYYFFYNWQVEIDACASMRTPVNVNIIPLPEVSLGNDTIVCTGDSIILSVPDDYSSYLWNNDSENDSITIYGSGVYAITISDETGCENSDEITVAQSAINELNLGESTGFCEGESLILNAPTNYSEYLWNTGEQGSSIEINQEGYYSLNVFNEFGCTDSDTIFVEEISFPQPNLGNDTNLCPGIGITLSTENTYDEYNWSTNSNEPSIEISEEGSYAVTVNNSGCFGSDTIHITYFDVAEPNLDDNIQYCRNDSAMVSVQSTYLSYNWSTGDTTEFIYVNTPGNIFFEGTDNTECTVYDTANVSEYNSPETNLPDTAYLCGEDSIFMTTSGQFVSYNWNENQSNNDTLKILQEGNVSLEVIDVNGCTFNDSSYIESTEAVNVDIGNQYYVCSGNSITLNAGEGFDEYYWSVANQQDSTILITEEGPYAVTVVNSYGCSAADDAYVSITYPAEISFDVINESDAGANDGSITTQINGGLPDYTFNWNNGDETQNISNLEAGTYILTLTDAAGCITEDTAIVQTETGIISKNIKDKIIVFPNPSNEKVTILNTESFLRLELINSTGKVIIKQEIKENHIILNSGELPAGVYLIKLTGEENKQNLRIIVQ